MSKREHPDREAVAVNATLEERSRWIGLAGGRDLSEWIRERCNAPLGPEWNAVRRAYQAFERSLELAYAAAGMSRPPKGFENDVTDGKDRDAWRAAIEQAASDARTSPSAAASILVPPSVATDLIGDIAIVRGHANYQSSAGYIRAVWAPSEKPCWDLCLGVESADKYGDPLTSRGTLVVVKLSSHPIIVPRRLIRPLVAEQTLHWCRYCGVTPNECSNTWSNERGMQIAIARDDDPVSCREIPSRITIIG